MSEMLAALLRSLQQSGVDVDADSALDSLWLALRMRAGTSDASGRETGEQPSATTTTTRASTASVTSETESPRATLGASVTPNVPPVSDGIPRHTQEFAIPDLELDGTAEVEGRIITLERASALSRELELTRSLRPLRRRVKAPGRGALDVEATVQRAIAENIFIPSFVSARERWLDVLLVLDHGMSMIVWKETLDELARVLRGAGAFRSVRSFWLESDATPLRVTPRGGAPVPRSSEQLPLLAHARTRTVILVVTDCVSGRWHDATIPALLAAWGKSVPVALLQVTPEWFWPRTALGDAAQAPLHLPAPLARNGQLKWNAEAAGLGGLEPEEAGPFVPTPVSALTPAALGALARVLAGVGEPHTPGVLFDLSWRGVAVGVGATRAAVPSPAVRVSRFHALASPGARRLAAAFACSPIQTLGMLRLLRRDLLNSTSQFVEAEVLLGGLVRVRREDASWEAGASLRLEFVEGVRELLHDSAATPDVLRVLRHASALTGARAGTTFSAWLSNPELATTGLEALGDAFAEAAAPVLRRLGGGYARAVRRISAVQEARTTAATERADSATSSDAPETESTLASGDVPPSQAANAPATAFEETADVEPTEQLADAQQHSHKVEVPHPMYGRERELARLDEWSRSREGYDDLMWIHGNAGVGKTSLVAAFIRDWGSRNSSNAFYWSFAIESSVVDCVRSMARFYARGAVLPAQETESLIPFLLRCFERRAPRLVVLDALDELDDRHQATIARLVAELAGGDGAPRFILVGRVVKPASALDPVLKLEGLGEETIAHWLVESEALAYLIGNQPKPELSLPVISATRVVHGFAGGDTLLVAALIDALSNGNTDEELRNEFAPDHGDINPITREQFELALPRFAAAQEVRNRTITAIQLRERAELSQAREEITRAVGQAEAMEDHSRSGRRRLARALFVGGDISLAMGKQEQARDELMRAAELAEGVDDEQMAQRARELIASLDAVDEERQSIEALEAAEEVQEVHAEFYVLGRVQGVFFRTFVTDEAAKLGITAAALNLPDGSIRVSAGGKGSLIDLFEQRLRVGPSASQVTRVRRSVGESAPPGRDIYLSFAHADAARARELSQRLQECGWTVFPDLVVPSSSEVSARDVFESLDTCGCVVAILSPAALINVSLAEERQRGIQRDNLVPVQLEPVADLPANLQERQIVDLSQWDNTATAPDFLSLQRAIEAKIGVPEGRSAAPPLPTPPPVAEALPARVRVTAKSLNLRSRPSTSGSILGVVSRNAMLDVIGRNGEWWQVNSGSVRGFVNGQFVEVLDAPPSNDSQSQSASGVTPPSSSSESSESFAADLDLATLDLTILDGPAWILVPGGTFRMGASDGDMREQPMHSVTCMEMRMSRYPITNRQYLDFVTATGHERPSHWQGEWTGRGLLHQPVTNIAWKDAVAYCEWLTGLVPTEPNGAVRLPTEAQWEFAAAGSERRRYPWGESPPTREHAHFGGERQGLMDVNAHPAGATPLGVCDMAGNAWEWCRDWYGDYESGPSTNPTGPAKGSARVTRGGSFRSEADKLRSTYRQSRQPHRASDRIGFRVVWSLELRSDIPARNAPLSRGKPVAS